MPDTPNPMLMWIASEAGDETASRARTAFGTTYRVMLDGDTQRWQALHFAFSLTEYISGSPFPDEATARAACEADYRERMRKAGWVRAGEVEASEDRCKAMVREFLGLYGTPEAVAKFCEKHLASTPLATTPVVASESPSGSDNAEAVRALVAALHTDADNAEARGNEEGDPWSHGRESGLRDAADRLTALLPEKEERS